MIYTSKDFKSFKEKLETKCNDGRRISYADIRRLLICKEKWDFTPMFGTRFYKNHGVAYCHALELLF